MSVRNGRVNNSIRKIKFYNMCESKLNRAAHALAKNAMRH
jgi:hypothetical protein